MKKHRLDLASNRKSTEISVWYLDICYWYRILACACKAHTHTHTSYVYKKISLYIYIYVYAPIWKKNDAYIFIKKVCTHTCVHCLHLNNTSNKNNPKNRSVRAAWGWRPGQKCRLYWKPSRGEWIWKWKKTVWFDIYPPGKEHIAWEVRKSIDSKVPKKRGICRIC